MENHIPILAHIIHLTPGAIISCSTSNGENRQGEAEAILSKRLLLQMETVCGERGDV